MGNGEWAIGNGQELMVIVLSIIVSSIISFKFKEVYLALVRLP